jgi:hypothetical protein
MSQHSRLQRLPCSVLGSTLAIALGSTLLSPVPAEARQVVLNRVVVINSAPGLYGYSGVDPLLINTTTTPIGYPANQACYYPCVIPHNPIGVPSGIVNGSVVNSTLVNPVVVNSPIYNSTLVNPVIIPRPLYRPGIQGSFSISF